MQVINYGSNFEIYEDDLKTYDQLPAGTYNVKFNPMSGFSLKKTDDFKQAEEKIYGNHIAKIEKVFKSFDLMKRSLGIILSGDKGIGKSLFTQLMAEHAVHRGMAVIIVDRAFKGIAGFLDSIDQEALVLFDEFEKVFNERNDNNESQDALLGLFDGTSQKKRVYAITVNDLYKVNEFMINRPGRFHYHFRFDYPEGDEIKTYLQDKVPAEYHGQITGVTNFARRIKLNYDCLRAIAFELSLGISFAEAISDLNILNVTPPRYSVEIVFADKKSIKIKNERIDLFEEEVYCSTYQNGEEVGVTFKPSDLVELDGHLICSGEKVEMDYEEDNTEYTKALVVTHVIVSQVQEKKMHYSPKAF